MNSRKNTKPESDTVVISFRAPRELVTKLDEMAKGNQRTRANFIVRVLTQAVTLEPAINMIEQILPRFIEQAQQNPDSIQTEYARGAMWGARSMLGAFFGGGATEWVVQQVKQRTKLPMPHIVPRNPDGKRYGFDSYADF